MKKIIVLGLSFFLFACSSGFEMKDNWTEEEREAVILSNEVMMEDYPGLDLGDFEITFGESFESVNGDRIYTVHYKDKTYEEKGGGIIEYDPSNRSRLFDVNITKKEVYTPIID